MNINPCKNLNEINIRLRSSNFFFIPRHNINSKISSVSFTQTTKTKYSLHLCARNYMQTCFTRVLTNKQRFCFINLSCHIEYSHLEEACSERAWILKEIAVAILMIVESGYDSSSGKEECNEFVLHEYTNLCRCWLSRGLCVAGKPNEIYRKRGIWKLQKIDTNSIENVEERSLIRHSRTLVLPEKYRLHETP